MSNIARSSSSNTISQQGLPVIQTPFGAIQLTPDQLSAMFQQMQMQQMQQMQQMPHTQMPHKMHRVLNAPKRMGRSGLPSARVEHKPAPAEDEVLRPFAYACHQLFAKLVRAADGAFYNIPEGAPSNLVKGIRLDDVFKCVGHDGNQVVISVADALYGFRVKGGHFTERRQTHRAYHITNPFEAAQIYALSKGYYLANASDPSKGLGLHIVVYREDPAQKVALWHGQNLQPNNIAAGVDLKQEGFEDITSFYMKPIREAARYINSTFEQDDDTASQSSE